MLLYKEPNRMCRERASPWLKSMMNIDSAQVVAPWLCRNVPLDTHDISLRTAINQNQGVGNYLLFINRLAVIVISDSLTVWDTCCFSGRSTGKWWIISLCIPPKDILTYSVFKSTYCTHSTCAHTRIRGTVGSIRGMFGLCYLNK